MNWLFVKKAIILQTMLKKILTLFVLSLLLVSCNREYEKLLKSNDFGVKLEKAYEYYKAEEYYKAQMLFEQVRPFYRGRPELEGIFFHYAYTQFHQKKYILSSHYFRDFANNYPNSEFAEESAYMAAYSHYRLSPNIKLEQTYTEKAIEGMQLFVNTFPSSERVAKCNILIDELRAKLEEKAISSANLYYKLQEYQAATHSYKNVLKDYPDTKAASTIRLKILQASYELALNSIDDKKEERLQETINEYLEFVDRHPESDKKSDAEKIYKAAQQRLEKIRKS
jgi:outer membrane protein assembly factor BamD